MPKGAGVQSEFHHHLLLAVLHQAHERCCSCQLHMCQVAALLMCASATPQVQEFLLKSFAEGTEVGSQYVSCALSLLCRNIYSRACVGHVF